LIALSVVIALCRTKSDGDKYSFAFCYRFYNQERAITMYKKRSHRPIYKTDTKNEAKRLGSTTCAISTLEEQYFYGE
jgi:hypothetical protein